MNALGRKTVIGENVIAKLTEAFKEGATDELACQYAQIHPSTFYRHKESNKDFAREIEAAKSFITLQAARVVAQAIKSGNLQAAKWWLERKLPSEFGNKVETKTVTENIFSSPEFQERYSVKD